MFELISQGAEARLYAGNYLDRNVIVKERFPKAYRHPALNERLTKERLRAELRGLQRARAIGIRTPTVYFVDGKKSAIYMERFMNVETVNVTIGKLLEDEDKLKLIGHEVGMLVGKLHNSDIIHGDLTTSNILVQNSSPQELILIDFGLSYLEDKSEDKGVDLYVLERAFQSTHSKIPWIFNYVLKGYSESNLKDCNSVLKKLDEVRLRGRKRTMVG